MWRLLYLHYFKKENNMARTSYGLPGIYNASPITLPDQAGSALAVNSSGQLIVVSPGGGNAEQVQGTAADNAAAVGNPVYIGGIYNSGIQTYNSGDVAALQTDINGDLYVNLATKLDPINDTVTANEGAWNVTTITTATTTLIAAFPCYIKRVKTLGATVLGNVTVYDSLTATGTNPVPTVAQVVGQSVIDDPLVFSVGCTVVTTGTAPVVLVAWRAQ